MSWTFSVRWLPSSGIVFRPLTDGDGRNSHLLRCFNGPAAAGPNGAGQQASEVRGPKADAGVRTGRGAVVGAVSSFQADECQDVKRTAVL
jgi:hypothetical protein